RAWTDGVSIKRGFCVLVGNRAAVGIFRIAPCGLAIGSRGDQFSVCAIDDVEVAITVGLGDQVLAVRVDEDGDLRSVPVVLVVLRELEVPVELAGVGIQREQGVGVEIVSGATLAAIGRSGIASWPENLIGCRIVGAGIPGRGAADFPGVTFPCVVSS